VSHEYTVTNLKVAGGGEQTVQNPAEIIDLFDQEFFGEPTAVKKPKVVKSKNTNNPRKISSQSQIIDPEDFIDKRPRFDSNIEDDIEVNIMTLKPKRPLLAINTSILRQNST
jgi:hypothetical protein